MSDIIRSQLAFAPTTTWKTSYQRNYKSGGNKNLGCFPACFPTGHVPNAFCGAPVVVDFNLELVESAVAPETVNNLVCFGHFLCEDEDGIQMGELIDENISKQLTRGHGNYLRPWIEGGVNDIRYIPLSPSNDNKNQFVQVRFIINEDKRGWHYTYKSSKKTRNTNHRFEAFICERLPTSSQAKYTSGSIGAQQFRVLHTCASPEWKMYCRRRLDQPPCKHVTDDTYEAWPEIEPFVSNRAPLAELLNPGKPPVPPPASATKSKKYVSARASTRVTTPKLTKSKACNPVLKNNRNETKNLPPIRKSGRKTVKTHKMFREQHEDCNKENPGHVFHNSATYSSSSSSTSTPCSSPTSAQDKQEEVLEQHYPIAIGSYATSSPKTKSLIRPDGVNVMLDSDVVEQAVEGAKVYLRSSNSVQRLRASGKSENAYTYKRCAHPVSTSSPLASSAAGNGRNSLAGNGRNSLEGTGGYSISPTSTLYMSDIKVEGGNENTRRLSYNPRAHIRRRSSDGIDEMVFGANTTNDENNAQEALQMLMQQHSTNDIVMCHQQEQSYFEGNHDFQPHKVLQPLHYEHVVPQPDAELQWDDHMGAAKNANKSSLGDDEHLQPLPAPPLLVRDHSSTVKTGLDIGVSDARFSAMCKLLQAMGVPQQQQGEEEEEEVKKVRMLVFLRKCKESLNTNPTIPVPTQPCHQHPIQQQTGMGDVDGNLYFDYASYLILETTFVTSVYAFLSYDLLDLDNEAMFKHAETFVCNIITQSLVDFHTLMDTQEAAPEQLLQQQELDQTAAWLLNASNSNKCKNEKGNGSIGGNSKTLPPRCSEVNVESLNQNQQHQAPTRTRLSFGNGGRLSFGFGISWGRTSGGGMQELDVNNNNSSRLSNGSNNKCSDDEGGKVDSQCAGHIGVDEETKDAESAFTCMQSHAPSSAPPTGLTTSYVSAGNRLVVSTDYPSSSLNNLPVYSPIEPNAPKLLGTHQRTNSQSSISSVTMFMYTDGNALGASSGGRASIGQDVRAVSSGGAAGNAEESWMGDGDDDEFDILPSRLDRLSIDARLSLDSRTIMTMLLDEQNE